jgi:hypothetical protein
MPYRPRSMLAARCTSTAGVPTWPPTAPCLSSGETTSGSTGWTSTGTAHRSRSPPLPPTPAGLRHGDLRVTPELRLPVCVREDPQASAVGRSELVALPTDGSSPPWVLAGGRDFYAAPRPSPDGRQLAWLSWDRPQMPWDGSDLWVAELTSDGRLGPARHVAGGPEESIMQPEWSPSGELFYVSDRSGWWNLYRCHPPIGRYAPEPLLPMAAEFADPPWELDYSTYVLLGDGRIACRYRQAGTDHLALLDPRTGRLQQLGVAFTSIKPHLRATGGRLAFIGATPTIQPAIISLDLATRQPTVLANPQEPAAVDAGYLSLPSRSPSPPATARPPTACTSRQPTATPSARPVTSRRCWCSPIPAPPRRPPPGWSGARSSSPAAGSRWSASTTRAAAATAAATGSGSPASGASSTWPTASPPPAT